MRMRQKPHLATVILAAALLGPAVSSADDIAGIAPPPPRAEIAPPQRDGYVWASGYWDWNGRFFRWQSGTWISEHRRAHWVADRWEQDGSQWHRVRGHWEE